MTSILQDLRVGLRAIRRHPAFAATVVLTLGLGIGASSAIVSVANGVLLNPLPYADPDRVVTLWTSWDYFPDKTWVSVPEFQLFRQETRTLDLALYRTGGTAFTSVESPERASALGRSGSDWRWAPMAAGSSVWSFATACSWVSSES